MQASPDITRNYIPQTFIQNSNESKVDKLKEADLADKFSHEDETLPEQLLTKLRGERQLDEDFFVTQRESKKALALDIETLCKMVDVLTQDFSADPRSPPYEISVTLIELLNLYEGNYKFVGSFAFFILIEHYLINFLHDQGLKKSPFLVEFLKSLKVLPNDIDIRIYLLLSNRKILKNSKKKMDYFLAGKWTQAVLEENPAYEVDVSRLRQAVHDECYQKRNTEYSDSNCYTTLTLKQYEFLIVEELKNESLFIRDALQIDFTPLVKALNKFGGDGASLKHAIRLGKLTLDIIPESDYPNILQVIIDHMANLLRVENDKINKIDKGGWTALMSYLSKGLTCVDPLLEPSFKKTFFDSSHNFRGMLEAPAFLLKKTLKYHHPNNPLDAFAITFNSCFSLKEPSYCWALWLSMQPLFSACEHPVVIQINTLMMKRASFDEILALLQVRALLQYVTKNQDNSFKVTLPKQTKNQAPIFKILLSTVYLQIPINIQSALQILFSSQNVFLKGIIENFPIPKEPYLKKKLNLNVDFENIEMPVSFKREIKLMLFIQTGEEKAFELLLDEIEHYIDEPRLEESLKNLSLSQDSEKVWTEFQEFKISAKRSPRLNLALALARSVEPLHYQTGCRLFDNTPSENGFKKIFIRSIALHRPDLAIGHLLSLDEEKKDLLPVWLTIVTQCQRRKNKEFLDLPVILQGFHEIVKADLEVTKFDLFLKNIQWIFDIILTQNKFDELQRLITKIQKCNFPAEAAGALSEFWLNCSEKISDHEMGLGYFSLVWDQFKILNCEVSAKNKAKYQKLLLKQEELDALLNEHFLENFQETAKSKIIKIVSNGIHERHFDILNKILNSPFDFSKSLQSEVIALYKHVLMENSIEELFLIQSKANLESFFSSKEELYSFVFLFLEKALSANFEFIKFRKWLRASLEYIERNEVSSELTIACISFLLRFFKVHSLEDKPNIARSIHALKGKFLQFLRKEELGEKAHDFFIALALQKKENRLDETTFEDPFFNSINLSLAEIILEKRPTKSELKALFSLFNKVEVQEELRIKLIKAIFETNDFSLHFIVFDWFFENFESYKTFDPFNEENLKVFASSFTEQKEVNRLEAFAKSLAQLKKGPLLEKTLTFLLEKWLASSPNALEINVFFDFLHIFESLNAKFYADLMEAVFQEQELELQYRAWNLQLQLEREERLLHHKNERVRSWICNLSGLNQFSDSKILDIFENVELLNFLFQEKKAAVISFECLSKVYKKEPKDKLLKRVFEFFHRKKNEEIVINLSHILATSHDKETLFFVFDHLILELRSKNREKFESVVLPLIQSMLAQEIEESSWLWYCFNDLIELVKKECSPRVIIALIDELGRHNSDELVTKSIQLLDEIKKRKLKKNELELLGQACFPAIQNAIVTHFNGKIGGLLLNCISDEIGAYIDNPKYPKLLLQLVEKCEKLAPPIFYFSLYEELNQITNFILNNLNGFKYGSLDQFVAIKRMFNIIFDYSVARGQIQNAWFDFCFLSLKFYSTRNPSQDTLSTKINKYQMTLLKRMYEHFGNEDSFNEQLFQFSDSCLNNLESKKGNTNEFKNLITKHNDYVYGFYPDMKLRKFSLRMAPLQSKFMDYLIVGGSSFLINKYLFSHLLNLNEKFPVCLSIPSKLTEFALGCYQIKQFIVLPFSEVTNVILRQTLFSEFCFRFVLQELLLKKMPEKILKKIAPSFAPYLNSLSAKVARIAFASFIYTASNVIPENYPENQKVCELVNCITFFACGLLFGAFQELTGKPYLSWVSHLGFCTRIEWK